MRLITSSRKSLYPCVTESLMMVCNRLRLMIITFT